MPGAPVKVATYGGKPIFRPGHQGDRAPSENPTYKYITPQSGNVSSAWQTQGASVDFALPKSLGTIDELMLRFEVKNTAAQVLAVPTPFWISSAEICVGSTAVETLYPTDIFNESVGFLDLTQLDSMNEVLKCSATNYIDATDQYVDGSTNSFAYLPLQCSLTAAKLFVKCLEDEVRIRIYFPANFWAANPTVTLASLMLIVTEASGSAKADELQKAAHKSGINYGTIVRQRSQIGVTRNIGSENTVDLPGLTGHSAGLIVYAQAPGVFNASQGSSLQDKYDIPTITILDQMGSKVTEQLHNWFLRSKTWVSEIGASFPARPNCGTYLIPFANGFRQSVETGLHSGEKKMAGDEKIVLGTAAADASWMLYVTNYTYQSWVVSDNRLTRVVKEFNF